MLWRIHPNDDTHLADSLVGLDDLLLRRALEHDPEAIQKAFGLLRDFTDLVVANNGIESVKALGLTMVQPFQFSQLAKMVMGDAVRAVCLWRDQIKAVDITHPHYSRGILTRYRGRRSFSPTAFR